LAGARSRCFVSVRSGAALSMPGMMDTLLNCGLTFDLAREHGDPAWFLGTLHWRLSCACFAKPVAGLKEEPSPILQGRTVWRTIDAHRKAHFR